MTRSEDAVSGRRTRSWALSRGRFAGATGWSTTAFAVSAVTGVLTARGLGPESRGTLALAVSIAGLCVLISAFGTNVSIRRHLPRNPAVTMRGYERLSLLLVAPLAVVLTSVLYLTMVFVDPAFGRWEVGAAFLAYGVAYYFSNQGLDLLNAVGLVVKSARTNALGSVFCLVLVALATLLKLGLAVIICCYALGALVQAILAIAIVVRRGRVSGEAVLGARVLLRDGGKLLGLNVGQNLAYRADTVLLGALSGQGEVGLYAVATTPASVLRIPSNALGQAAFHDAADGRLSSRAVLGRLVKLFMVLIPVAAVGWIVADWILVLVYGSEYAAAADAFRVLLIAELALAPFLVIGRVVAGLGSTLGASASGLIGVLMLLGFGVAFIPSMGAVGAAWASVIAYSSMSLTASAVLVKFRRDHRRRSGHGDVSEGSPS